MNRWVYDIEVFPNYFSAAFESYDTDERKMFEIYDGVNDSLELVKFLKSIDYLVGFNSIHYDNLHLVSIIKSKSSNEDLYNLTQQIIEFENFDYYKNYRYFPYGYKIKSIDLYLYWSKMLRLSKMLSLKSLACQLNFHNIQELPFKPGTVLTKEQIDVVRKYNFNDVEVTKLLAKKMSDDINLRFDAKKQYGFECYSWDGPKLGSQILIKKYCDKFSLNKDKVLKKQTLRDSVKLSDIILPEVKFKKGSIKYHWNSNIKALQFESFYGLHQYLMTKEVKSTKEIACRVLYNNIAYDIKSGGIHSYHKNDLIIPKKGFIYEDWDVESYYPSLGIEWSMVPEHMPGLDKLLREVKAERSELKEKGLKKSPASKLIKLAMNGGFYGMTNNKYSPFFDWKCTMSITINGQLFLCMLSEWCEEIGVSVDMCNTDGVSFMIPENKYNDFKSVVFKWEKLTKLKLEGEEFSKVIRKNINNYLAITKSGNNKKKGMFKYEKDIPLGDSTDNQIIPKALEAYYVHGTSVEKFIKEHDNIYDFTASPKVAKKFTVTWKGKVQQNLNRFYVSKKGAYLYKQKKGLTDQYEAQDWYGGSKTYRKTGEKTTFNPENVLKGYVVQLFNKYEEKPMSEYNINYDWYIMKCREVIEELEPKQQTLF